MPSTFYVSGGRALKGTVRPAGNKNAALPILAATLLADGPPHRQRARSVTWRRFSSCSRNLRRPSRSVNTVEIEDRARAAELDPALSARIARLFFRRPCRPLRAGSPPPARPSSAAGAWTHISSPSTAWRDDHRGTLTSRASSRGDFFLDGRASTATENALMASVGASGTPWLRRACEPLCRISRVFGGLRPPHRRIVTNTLP